MWIWDPLPLHPNLCYVTEMLRGLSGFPGAERCLRWKRGLRKPRGQRLHAPPSPGSAQTRDPAPSPTPDRPGALSGELEPCLQSRFTHVRTHEDTANEPKGRQPMPDAGRWGGQWCVQRKKATRLSRPLVIPSKVPIVSHLIPLLPFRKPLLLTL